MSTTKPDTDAPERPVKCLVCKGQMYYVLTPQHEPEVTIRIAVGGHYGDEYAHRRCWDSLRASTAPAGQGHWSSDPPTEQGWYWHWDGNKDSAPFPLSVLRHGAGERKCFVSLGQAGLERAVECDEYGGLWTPLRPPGAAPAATAGEGEAALTDAEAQRLIDWHEMQLTEADAMGYDEAVKYHEGRKKLIRALAATPSRPAPDKGEVASGDTHQIEKWLRDLNDAGWHRNSISVFQDPEGRLWRGPYGAWRELQRRNSSPQ